MIWFAIYYFIGVILLAAGCRVSGDKYSFKNIFQILTGAVLWLPLVLEIVVKAWVRR